MALHLRCDECIKLWQAYAVAIRLARETKPKRGEPIVPGVEDALQRIRQHEALDHGRVER